MNKQILDLYADYLISSFLKQQLLVFPVLLMEALRTMNFFVP